MKKLLILLVLISFAEATPKSKDLVIETRHLLDQNGFLAFSPKSTVDADFTKAVQRFEKEAGFEPRGVVNPGLILALQKYSQLRSEYGFNQNRSFHMLNSSPMKRKQNLHKHAGAYPELAISRESWNQCISRIKALGENTRELSVPREVDREKLYQFDLGLLRLEEVLHGMNSVCLPLPSESIHSWNPWELPVLQAKPVSGKTPIATPFH